MRPRMKGYMLRWRPKELCLLLIILMGATVLMLTFDRSSPLTPSLPSKNPLLLLSPDIKRVPLEPKRHVREEISTLTQGEFIHDKEEHHLDKTTIDTAKSSSDFETVPIPKKICNYAKGKWVIDDRRPLYSGFGCKQWLAPMWACRLMQRQDFAFEKLRWQPKDCEMEEFEGTKFLKRLQDKTLAFVGDSLGRQQFQSLMCMITAGEDSSDVLDVGNEYGLFIPPGGVRPDGWAYRFLSTNTTVLYYWSSGLCEIEPFNVKDPRTEYAMHLDRPPSFLHQFLHKIDVLVLNTGHHWNRGKLRANRWIMYVEGAPNTNRMLADIGNAKNFTIHNTVKWLDSQLPKHPRLKAFYRSISPRHFVNGDWNTGGSCNNTRPMSIGKDVLQEESSDPIAASAVRGTGVKLLDITALSQVRDEGHISRFSITSAQGVQDCLHWCLPGVPDTWNEILFAQI
ncbi:TRICHOME BIREFRINGENCE-LIKE 16 [Hibiscus trionum]|uniref:TRICHOME BIREFRINGENCE-LIKE 16 n=2 Tax=Hibiscus trionum TaxID=183268 RepID=A0A9W7MH63_HIBTR|nr:TRICHOME BIREFRINGENCE-LIKE 16 [Hibiscus trionum]